MNDTTKTKWVMNGLLAVILVLLGSHYAASHPLKSAHAGSGWDTDGVMVLSGSINQRLVIVDTEKKNIMVYHAQNGGKFGLTAVRSYEYDILAGESSQPIVGQGLTYIQVRAMYSKQTAP